MEAAPRAFLTSVALIIVTGMAPAAGGVLTKVLVDHLVNGETSGSVLWPLVGILAGVALAGSSARFISDGLREDLRERLQAHLRLKVSAQSARLDLAFFELPGNYDTFAKARDDLGFRPFLMAYALIGAVGHVTTVVGFFLAVVTFQPVLALALVLASLPTLLVAGKSGMEAYNSHDLTTHEGRRAIYVEELLHHDTHAKEVRLYGLASELIRQLSVHVGRVVRARLAVIQRKAARLALADGFSVVVQYGALAFVVAQVAADRATLGDLTLLIAALAGVRTGLTQGLASLGDLMENSLFFQDLHHFLGIEPTIVTRPQPAQVPSVLRRGLAIEGLVFSYPGSETKIFDGLNMELRAGEATALVGVNGAGKTTLVKLLARLYDPQGGRVTLDGIDIRDFDPDKYRAALAVVLQDFERYRLSARENVAFGRIDEPLEQERLQHAVEAAGARDLIQHLPEGWDTLLGRLFHERGQDLSGGQWQRIALARALYRDAPILLLDEPTAALDSQAEAEIFLRYRDLMRGRLSLLISHRFNTVRFVDRIVVLDGGRLIEDGSHDELMRLGGRYAAMFEAQAEAYTMASGH